VVVVNNDGGGIFEGLEPARFGGGAAGGSVSGGRAGGSVSGGSVSGGGVAGRDRSGRPAALTVFERTFGTPHGASLERLAGAFGVPYTLAAQPGDVAKAVAATVSGTGPRIVEVRTGRAANAELRARMRDAGVRAATAASGSPR
jgi:2-succinyl-5-enolpyruvyl-6-hydroxy-3-cyclohexene-1-carboxylate synthase